MFNNNKKYTISRVFFVPTLSKWDVSFTLGQVSRLRYLVVLAEVVRFELTVPFDTPVFKTGALNHYATPPYLFNFWALNYITLFLNIFQLLGFL